MVIVIIHGSHHNNIGTGQFKLLYLSWIVNFTTMPRNYCISRSQDGLVAFSFIKDDSLALVMNDII